MIVTLYKTDSRGRPCYYTVHDRQGHLFSSNTFTTVWGPEPGRGREKARVFDTPDSMDLFLRRLIRQKLKQGYTLLYSFSRNNRHNKLFKDLAREELGISSA